MSQSPEALESSVDPTTEEATIESTRIRDLLGLLGKTLRAHQMYQANNPVYHRFLESLSEAFTHIWEVVAVLHLEVTETGFIREGERYTVSEGRDRLAFQFFKDGVRYLTFLPGFEEELERFLEVIVHARKLGTEEDDLVTLLWEQDFGGFRYGYVDVLAEGLELPETDEPHFEPISPEALKTGAAEDHAEDVAGTEGGSSQPAPASLTPDDFNETLYLLEEDEFDKIRVELDNEWARDLKTDVLNGLFDRLEDADSEWKEEILGILRQMLPVFLARGDMASAAKLLQELDGLLARDDVLDAELRAEADGLFDELSEPAVIGELIRALEDGGIDPESAELSLFLSRLRSSAIPVLFHSLETSASSAVRERLQLAADRLSEQHPEVVAELLAAENGAVAAGAAHAAGRIQMVIAADAIVRLLGRPESSTRLAAVEALVAIRSDPAIEGLNRALDDESREIRIAAARGLGSLRSAPARERLEEVVAGRALRDADLTEKLAFFEAYADVGGGEAVSVLDRLLNDRGRFGRRQPPEIRACAATALGRIGVPAARTSLERAAGEKDTIVRSAVARALRREAPAS